jgi:hypothetical protein
MGTLGGALGMITWLIIGGIVVFILFNVEVGGVTPGEVLLDALRTVKDYLQKNSLKIIAIGIGSIVIYILLKKGLWWILLGALVFMAFAWFLDFIGFGDLLDAIFGDPSPFIHEKEEIEVYSSEWFELKKSVRRTLEEIKGEWKKLKEEIRNTLKNEKETIKDELRSELKKELDAEFSILEAEITRKLNELQEREKRAIQKEEELIALKNDLEYTIRTLEHRIEEFEEKEERLTALLNEAKELAGIGEEYKTLLKVYQELSKELEQLTKKEEKDFRDLHTEIIKLHSWLSRMEEHLIKHRTEHPEEAREVDKAVFAEILRNNLGLKEKEIEIIEYLLKRGKRHQRGLADAVGIKDASIKPYIDHLESLGLIKIERTGKKKYIILNRVRLVELGVLPQRDEDIEEEDF